MEDKITMIELFSGIGAQERALRQIGIPYEIIATCDCDKDAVLSYASMRSDFDKELNSYEFPSVDEMIKELQSRNIGFDFMKGKHTITSRTPIDKLKQYYLADKLSKNLGDIGKVGKLPYADMVTYSFPCTDLSVAGKGEGMVIKCDKCGHSWPIDFSVSKSDIVCPNCGNTNIKSTRSGLLGEVQRLLSISYEEHTLPKYLLLENVKNLVGKKFKPQFDAWVKWLDSIGYNTYYEVLNAKHYGIPQNRERIFAVSIRKDIDNREFKFPTKTPLNIRLKDILEKDVDEKYYLPDDRIDKILSSTFMQEKKRIQMKDVCDTLLARDWKDPKCVQVEDNIKIVGNYMPSNHDASRVVDIDGIAPTVKENHGTVTAIAEPNIIKVGQLDSSFDQSGRVYSVDGIAPTVMSNSHGKTSGGYTSPKILVSEGPFIVASRGRNPDNPSDRTTRSPTEQRFEPNFSGTTNCLTSVQKDNYVCEPTVYNIGNIYPSNGQNGNVYDIDGISPTINAGVGIKGCGIGSNNAPKVIIPEPIVYDDYNSRISSNQEVINTLTTNCGASAERNGVKILEPIVCEERRDEGIRFFKDDCVGTLRTIDACGDKRVIEPEPQLEFVGGLGDKDWAKDGKKLSRNYPQGSRVCSSDGIASALTAQGVGGAGGYSGLYAVDETETNPKLVGGIGEKNFGKQYRQGNRVYDSDEIAMALNAQPVGNAGGYSYLYAVKEEQPKIRWRIRKLTPKECWRLMGFDDVDYERAAKNVSASSLYKQAGNSICTCCLVAIFNALFLQDYSASYVEKLVNYNNF